MVVSGNVGWEAVVCKLYSCSTLCCIGDPGSIVCHRQTIGRLPMHIHMCLSKRGRVWLSDVALLCQCVPCEHPVGCCSPYSPHVALSVPHPIAEHSFSAHHCWTCILPLDVLGFQGCAMRIVTCTTLPAVLCLLPQPLLSSLSKKRVCSLVAHGCRTPRRLQHTNSVLAVWQAMHSRFCWIRTGSAALCHCYVQ
jgi:hypothetical protein